MGPTESNYSLTNSVWINSVGPTIPSLWRNGCLDELEFLMLEKLMD